MTPFDLSRTLAAPPGRPVDERSRVQVGAHLAAGIDPVAIHLPAGRQLLMTLPALRRAAGDPESLLRNPEPFAWKPAFVRRSLGLAAVGACAAGRFRSPAAAVGPLASEAVEQWARTGWRTYFWEPWLGALTAGARAVVVADAVGWATALWSSFEWSAFDPAPVLGGADDQWTCPSARAVRLKGRTEMRVPLREPPCGSTPVPSSAPAGPGQERQALLTVSSGVPGPVAHEELAFLALVAAVGSPARPVPARVMGLWPDSGVHVVVDIDASMLMKAADRVVAIIGAAVDGHAATQIAA